MLRITPAHMRAFVRSCSQSGSPKPDEPAATTAHAVSSLATKVLDDVIKPLLNSNQPLAQEYLRAATKEKHIANYASIGWHTVCLGWIAGSGICVLLTWHKAYKEH